MCVFLPSVSPKVGEKQIENDDVTQEGFTLNGVKIRSDTGHINHVHHHGGLTI
jgi:hypothetical protein